MPLPRAYGGTTNRWTKCLHHNSETARTVGMEVSRHPKMGGQTRMGSSIPPLVSLLLAACAEPDRDCCSVHIRR